MRRPQYEGDMIKDMVRVREHPVRHLAATTHITAFIRQSGLRHCSSSHHIIHTMRAMRQQYFSTCHIIKVRFLRLIPSPTSYRAILLRDLEYDLRSEIRLLMTTALSVSPWALMRADTVS
jgi:hypothetical protein